MAIIKTILKQAGYAVGSFALACIGMTLLMALGFLLGFASSAREFGTLAMLAVFIASMAFFNLRADVKPLLLSR